MASHNETRWAKCCYRVIHEIMLGTDTAKKQEAVEFITEALMDDEFILWCGSWRIVDGTHPGAWLEEKLAHYREAPISHIGAMEKGK